MEIQILIPLVSGLLSALVTIYIYGVREKRKFKMDTLKRFAANRYDVKGAEFTKALNEIFVVFNDSLDVMRMLGEFHKAISSGQPNDICNDALLALYKAMCRDLRIKYNTFSDSFFLKPFNTKYNS